MYTYVTLHTQSSNIIFVHDYRYFIEGYINNLIKTPWNIINNTMLLAASFDRKNGVPHLCISSCYSYNKTQRNNH